MSHLLVNDPRMAGRAFALSWSLASLVLLGGCGGEDVPPIGLVTGTVTTKGEPIPNLMVNFWPEGGRPSWGLTDEDGKYNLNWDAGHDGAEVGPNKVSIAPNMGSPFDAPKTKKARGPVTGMDAIVAKYGDPSTSPLRFEVKAGRQVIDIDLKVD